jgi:hypothetical protein
MDRVIVAGILVLVLSVAVILGTVLFALWAVQYFARRAYRQATRLHLFVPVEATVKGIFWSRRQTVVHVDYEFRGTTIQNRLGTSKEVARLADQFKQVDLLIDPDYPKDVVVAPMFETAAATVPKPPE